MKIQNNISLKPYNTFGIDVSAKNFVVINSSKEIHQVYTNSELKDKQKFILGGGSNILFTKDLNSIVLLINTKGIQILRQDDYSINLAVKAGENWHDFVLWCIDQDYGGIENLSLIPGNVGTAPIQNIGAYGVEVKDCIESVKVYDIENQTERILSTNECNFEYRNSVFKSSKKGCYIILEVNFKLTKTNHNHTISYGAIKTELKKQSNDCINLKNISDAVIYIRNSKLPNPKIIGNCGSFFKNPIIDLDTFKEIKKKFSNIPYYETSDSKKIKIPAGWLIEKCGFKGFKEKNVGVHDKQALVLINLGNATGKEVLLLANKIQSAVKDKFNVSIQAEVNIV